MAFNSLQFIVFFAIVLILYFSIPSHYRNWLLLISSYYYYITWKPEFLLLLFTSTIFSYFIAQKIETSENPFQKKSLVILLLILNLGLLFFYKYINFFGKIVTALLVYFKISHSFPEFDLLQPIGISFYTFQIIGYIIDVYKKRYKAEKNFVIFALYVSFFPTIVAGPIERAGRLIPQFNMRFKFDYYRVKGGLLLMAWGFFKKVVIADRLAKYVNVAYGNPEKYSGFALLLASYFFAYQIYCDFSGYTDIARGAAKILGFDLMDNFKRPYSADSIRNFWTRWHISLTSWFRDYIYLPWIRNRLTRSKKRNFIRVFDYSIVIVFLLSGLWHGAGWNFVIWGGAHGLLYLMSVWLDEISNKSKYLLILKSSKSEIVRLMKKIVTFNLVTLTWIFFRSDSIHQVTLVLRKIAAIDFSVLSINILHNKFQLIISIIFIIFLETVHFFIKDTEIDQYVSKQKIFVRWAFYYILMLGLTFFTNFSTESPFIYAEF